MSFFMSFGVGGHVRFDGLVCFELNSTVMTVLTLGCQDYFVGPAGGFCFYFCMSFFV